MTVQERFFDKVVEFTGEADCWEWFGTKVHNGYGLFRLNGKMRYAHRVAYHFDNPDFPLSNKNRKHDLDHLCRNRACVNPKHLEPVTRRENIHRGGGCSLKPNATSKFPGVRWSKGKWQSRINIAGKEIYLGRFTGEQEAAEAYNQARTRYGV